METTQRSITLSHAALTELAEAATPLPFRALDWECGDTFSTAAAIFMRAGHEENRRNYEAYFLAWRASPFQIEKVDLSARNRRVFLGGARAALKVISTYLLFFLFLGRHEKLIFRL